MSYNSDPNVLVLSQILDANTGSPKLRAEAVSRYFEQQSLQHNALEQFTSVVDPQTMANGGVRSIFAKKMDLSKGGGQVVNFGTIGLPGGPGVTADRELTGETSSSLFSSYGAIVDWFRDGVEWTKDDVAHISAGATLEKVSVDLLSHKMGLVKQNAMLKRLIDTALAKDGTMGVDAVNVYRPGNKLSRDSLTADDTLSTEVSTSARARLSTLGAKPLSRNMNKVGSPVNGFLMFSSTMGMLPLRNDPSFTTAVSNADKRGSDNANFTGELLDWQGNSFYEMQVIDNDWDDYKGNPLIAKAIVKVAAEPEATGVFNKLIVNSANTKSLYFQWFGGKAFYYNRIEPLLVDSSTYYAWAINPDGSRVFMSYAASGNNGNKITITNILSPAVSGTTLDATVVGQLDLGSGSSVSSNIITLGSGTTLPASGSHGTWVYSNKVQAGAVIIQANSRGVPYARSFMFGTSAAAFATGSVEMNAIEQMRDFGFVKGRGFEMIYGTTVCRNAEKNINGYLLIEHALEHEGYPVPNKI
jgi:hypothetical protein